MSFRIARVGRFARRFLDAHRTARISAVFARSLHVEAGEDALCIVDASLGDGALNAVLEQPFGALADVKVGTPCIVGKTSFQIEEAAVLDFRDAASWTPPSMRGAPRGENVDALMQAALEMAPRDGAFRAAHDDRFAPDDPMTKALNARIRELATWMREARSDAPPVAALVGLGSGLTPAGDDFLGGAMIALHGVGQRAKAQMIADGIDVSGSGATTLLSRAMLRAAAEGVGGAALHELLAELGDNDAESAIALLSAIDRIGHTSGWDALAGALMALRSECFTSFRGVPQERARNPETG